MQYKWPTPPTQSDNSKELFWPRRSGGVGFPDNLPWQFLFYKDYTQSGGLVTSIVDSINGIEALPSSLITGSSNTFNAEDSTINDRVSFNFNGAQNTFYEFGGTTNYYDPALPYTLFALVNPASVAAAFRGICGIRGATASLFMGVSPGSNWTFFQANPQSNTDPTVRKVARIVATEVSDVWLLLEMACPLYGGDATPAENVILRYNGDTSGLDKTQDSFAWSGADNFSSLGKFMSFSSGSCWNGKIALLGGGRFLLTETQRAGLTAWVNQYYGLSF